MNLKSVGYTDTVLFSTIGNAVNVQSSNIGKPENYRTKDQVSRQSIVFILGFFLSISNIRAYPLFPTSLLIMLCSLRLLVCRKKNGLPYYLFLFVLIRRISFRRFSISFRFTFCLNCFLILSFSSLCLYAGTYRTLFIFCFCCLLFHV